MCSKENIKIDASKILCKISVGVGKNIREAQEALIVSKLKKRKNKLFNITIFNEKTKVEINNNHPINNDDEKVNEERLKSYEILTDFIEKHGNEEILNCFDSFLYDHKTKLLNKTGYLINVNKLKKENRYKDRVIVFMDIDNMHELNMKYGYLFVDEYINSIGKILSHNIRLHAQLPDLIKLPYNHEELKQTPHLLHRYNDSAGDEFIIDLYCPTYKDEFLVEIINRYLLKIYEMQEKMFEKLVLKNK